MNPISNTIATALFCTFATSLATPASAEDKTPTTQNSSITTNLIIPDGIPPFSKADADRLHNLAIGYIMVEPAAEDVGLVTRAFAQNKDDLNLRQEACLVFHRLAAANLITPKQSAPFVVPVLASLHSTETFNGASQALYYLASNLSPVQVADLAKEANQFVIDKNPVVRSRGAVLIQCLLPVMSQDQIRTSVKGLFRAEEFPVPPQDPRLNSCSIEASAQWSAQYALMNSATLIRDSKLAQTLADHFLSDASLRLHSKLSTIVNLYPLLSEPSQATTRTMILEHLDDQTSLYWRQGGAHPEYRHYVADVLVQLAPHLDATTRQLARKRTTEARENLSKNPSLNQADLDRIYEPVLTALDAPATQPATQPVR